MTRPSSVDSVRLRKRPTQTRLHLAIYKPSTILSAQVNDLSIAKGEYQITYDNSSGQWQQIESGMTMYVGSTPGAKDLGRIRVRSATSSVITVAENDHIDWADNLYLTVVAFYEPWGIFTRIVLDANNNPTFYKDYDIPYTDQNQLFNPILHMGPNYAGFIETGAFGMRFSSSGSFDPTDGSFPTGFSWIFEGGIPTGSNQPHPGLVQWTSPGDYTVRLIGTTDKGKSSTAHRHVVVMNRPSLGGNPGGAVLEWGLTNMVGSRKDHGWSVSLWVREQSDIDKITEGALVLIISDMRYGDDETLAPDKAIGGQAYARSNLLFAGYIEDESIEYNYLTSKLEFKAISITKIFEKKHSFSVSLESAANAMTWYQIRDMTVDKAMLHYLKWHSTLLDISDFHKTGDTKAVQFMDFGRGPVADSIYDLYESTLMAEVVADRQGSVWAEINANVVPTGSRTTIPTNMKLGKDDWLGGMDISKAAILPLSYAELGGIAYSGVVTGTNEPYLSGAPGDAPGYEGSVVAVSGLVISSQTQLNTLAGDYYARQNARYPEITVTLAGPYTNVDIAPQEFLTMDLASTDTWRKITWYDKRFLPVDINIEYDSLGGSMTMDITMEEETWGVPGDTIIIPVEPPYVEPDLPYWDFSFPPFPPLPPILPPIEVPPTTGDVVYGIFNNFLCRTYDFFSSVSPTWEKVPMFTGTILPTINHFYLDYLAPQNIAYVWSKYDDGGGNGPIGYYTNNLGAASPTWTKFWGSTQSDAELGVNTQRNIGYANIIPELQYQVMWGGKALLGTAGRFLVGVPFSWSGADMPNNYPNPDDGPYNMLYLGANTYLAYNNNTVMRSSAGGLGGWGSSGGIGILMNQCPVPWSGGVVWVTDDWGAGAREMAFDPLGWSGSVTQGRLIRCSPVIGSDKWYAAIIASASGYHATKTIDIINGQIYMFAANSAGGTACKLMRTNNLSSWQILWETSNPCAPLEWLKTDPNKMCTYYREGVASSKVLGTEDGGFTWYDKTGNLASLVGNLGTGSLRGGLKFVWTL